MAERARGGLGGKSCVGETSELSGSCSHLGLQGIGGIVERGGSRKY